MKAGRIRLIVAAVLMTGWLGYLGYLALGHPKPVVVSRSQLLQATYYVKGVIKLDARGKPEHLVQVEASFGPNRLSQPAIEIDNLDDVRGPEEKPLASGVYFLPLVAAGSDKYRVATLGSATTRRIAYPWTSDIEQQVQKLIP